MTNSVEAFVRPAITVGLVMAQIALAAMWALGIGGGDTAKDAFAGLGAFTMMAITFWFKERSEEKSTAATVAAVAAAVNPTQPPAPVPQP